MTIEEVERTREWHRIQNRNRRHAMSAIEREAYLARKRHYYRVRRDAMSPEERETFLARRRQNYRIRTAMSCEELQRHLARRHQIYRARRSLVRDEQWRCLEIEPGNITAARSGFQETTGTPINIPSSHASTSSTSSSTRVCCQICTFKRKRGSMFHIPGCTHSYCIKCVSKYIKSKLLYKNVSISCPAMNCNNLMRPTSLRSVIRSKLMDRWDMELSESTILSSQRVYCPYKNCSGMLINDNEGGRVIRQSECLYCHRLFCAQCRVPWHQGLNCDEFQRFGGDRKDMEKLQMLVKKKKWNMCPNCKVIVERTSGCVHITCRCRFEFCYRCGSKWKPSHMNRCQN